MKKSITKKIHTIEKLIPSFAISLYLSIYSTYYFEINNIKPYFKDYNDSVIRMIVVFIAYIIATFICTKNLKNHKLIKKVYLINAILFLFIMML